MTVGILKETFPGERRVAVIPAGVATLKKAGIAVVVEPGAGTSAGFPDDQYVAQGATVGSSRADVLAQADCLLQVRTPGANPVSGRADAEALRPGQVIVGMADPLGTPEAADYLATKGVTSFALELIPRITRAQSMDVLSSMATVAGYKAVLLAANTMPRMCPMLMTAAGTIQPAHAFVIGAGVAGLQAIASARRMGAKVEAYDVRPAVKEQIQSLGAKFVELPLESTGAEDKGGYAKAQDEAFYQKQRELMAKAVAAADMVITTAAIPGKKSPVLITADAVKGMRPGSVIVDLAAETGGNCELTEPGSEVVREGVTIVGLTNLAATMPYHASQLYARNVSALLQHLAPNGELALDFDDEITAGTCVTRSEVVA
jgi:H+-translocating NAD(P) transhydrogenase subunit alpha